LLNSREACTSAVLALYPARIAACFPVAPQRWLVVVIVLVLAGWALPRLLPPGADVGEQRARFVLPSRDTLLLGSLTLGAYMCEGAILDWLSAR
jgi:hypothetical protein